MATFKTLSELTGHPESTLRVWKARGKLPPTLTGAVVWDMEIAKQWAAANMATNPKSKGGRPVKIQSDDQWTRQAEPLIVFVQANGALPNAWSSDPEEREAGKLLTTYRRLRAKDTLPPRAVAWLTEHGADAAPTRDERWQAKAAQVVAFHAKHDRWPARSATDPAEAALGRWRAVQRTTNLNPERRSWLQTNAPGILD